MKITKSQLKKLIKEELENTLSEIDISGEEYADAMAGSPPEGFFGAGEGGLDRLRKEMNIGDAADFYSIPSEDLIDALGADEKTADEIDELLTNALIQAHRTMPFDEKYGKGKEARIGKYVLQILRRHS